MPAVQECSHTVLLTSTVTLPARIRFPSSSILWRRSSTPAASTSGAWCDRRQPRMSAAGSVCKQTASRGHMLVRSLTEAEV